MSLVLFGSFGDIATLADLALKIGLAINDCAGALTEFKELVTEVEAFASSVLQIKATLSSRQRLPCALTVAIGDALDICFDLLKRTHARIDQFNSKTSRAVGLAVLRKYWAVVGWEILGGRNEVANLRTRLSQQVNLVNTLLATSNSRDLESLRTQAENNYHELRTILVTLEKRLSGTMASFHFFDADGATRAATSIPPRVYTTMLHPSMKQDSSIHEDGVAFFEISFPMPLDTSKPEFKRYRTEDHGQHAPVLGRDGDGKIKYLTTSTDPDHDSEHDDDSSTLYILVTCAVRAENFEPTEVLISPVYTLRRQKGLLQHCLSPSASATLHAAILQLHNPVASGPEEIRGSGWLVKMIRASYNVRELERAPARMMLEEC